MVKKMKRLISSILMLVLLSLCLLTGCGNDPKSQLTQPSQLDISQLVDFVVQAEEGREFRILQLTDTQVIDPGQSRYPERIGNTTPLTDDQLYQECFYYIEESIKRTQPDLIIMTGDIVYGEFDDTGESLQKMVKFMDSFKVPWAPVWGNHDNESIKGVTWQCQQLENAEYCLFKRGEMLGNSNYSIAVQQGNKVIKVIYMLDSNGCGNAKSYSYLPEFGKYNQGEKVFTDAMIGEDVLDWINLTSTQITATLGYSPKKFAAFHIPIAEYSDAATFKGYQSSDRTSHFDISDPEGIDFGSKNEAIRGMTVPNFWELLTAQNFDGVFVGHNHRNDFSIVYKGIRLTCGIKGSTHDRYEDTMLGGTLITVAEGGETFTVEHCRVEKLTIQ